MFGRLKESVLSYIIKVMVHKREVLTKKERAAQDAFMAKLGIKRRKTNEPVIIAFAGLIGSGKSSVAKELAGHIGGTVVDGDVIRIELRKQGERYERARAIAENAALEVVKQGGNAILDSDFIDENKRASIRAKARTAGVRLVFVRVHCDLDVAIGRVITAAYHDRTDDFFGGAKSTWRGSDQSKGAAVKVREMVRRIPHHYRWINKGGGKWVLKNVPFTVFAEVDTTDPDSWKKDAERCAKGIMAH